MQYVVPSIDLNVVLPPTAIVAELRDLNTRLRSLAALRRPAEDPLKDFGGLVISDDEVDRIFAGLDYTLAHSKREVTSTPTHPEQHDPGPLGVLCRRFRLSALERFCVVVALAPEFDLRYERVFGYVQDDVTRRAPGVGLLIDLLDAHDPGAVRRLFLPDAPLMHWCLVHLFDRPAGEPCSLPAKGLRLDPLVVHHLLGQSHEATTHEAIETDDVDADSRRLAQDALQKSGASETVCIVLRGAAGAGHRGVANALVRDRALSVLWFDGRQVASGDLNPILIVRDTILQGAALVIDHAEAFQSNEEAGDRLVRATENADGRLSFVILICYGASVPPLNSFRGFIDVTIPLPTWQERLDTWRRALPHGTTAETEAIASAAAGFPLGRGKIADLARCLRRSAQPVTPDRIRVLCRAALPPRVAGVTEIDPRRSWPDLVLPEEVTRRLREFCSQARHRETVLGEWGFSGHLSGGKGLHALLAGPPGTGKTLAAEVVANALGRRLWRVDLAHLVSKYIGETEKNIDRIFRAAADADVALLFDEADSVFGRRSEVKDAHDRYANQEVSYLLQQMEEYEGVTLLATNLQRNIDEAFMRRLQFVIEFPFPDEEQRRRIWEIAIPMAAPQAELDRRTLARAIRLSGGHIRNIALAAAYLAADRGERIGMPHLWRAAFCEHQKVGQSWSPPEHERLL